ncbi:hypothetical protein BpHYR1_024456 [Brachionus plicatilis]|uniref:Uncharacterized protein n=1 Tax=Brachionus plicatilis TaxID=10195 RepID=A0A3M7PZL3_BRAPC|nr:hypothetical protein BpHYR1_024456 [Brachionus plicatilis]
MCLVRIFCFVEEKSTVCISEMKLPTKSITPTTRIVFIEKMFWLFFLLFDMCMCMDSLNFHMDKKANIYYLMDNMCLAKNFPCLLKPTKQI